jgi:hypothetical protein
MLKIKNCQIAAWLEAYIYVIYDEIPTFINCQLKYILINNNCNLVPRKPWSGPVTCLPKKWQYLTATRQEVARYSLMKYTSLRNK